MREIKFRGFDKETKSWVYGSLLLHDGGVVNIFESNDRRGFAVDPATVGQFSGLHDKDGKEIYEGDIVECVSWNEYFTNPATDEVMQPFRRKMYVDFRKGGFKTVEPMPDPMKDNEWDIIYNGDIVIIGNIHDNPELIKRH